MIAKWLFKWSANLPCRLISRDGETPYLERYYIGQLFGITAYLHRFVGGDVDRELHDHPWHALSVVLAGGYTEHRGHLDGDVGVKKRLVDVRRIHFISTRTMHRILSCRKETWTLFIHGKRKKGWGFFRALESDEVLYVPFDTRPLSNWWERALTGEFAGRQPFQVEVNHG